MSGGKKVAVGLGLGAVVVAGLVATVWLVDTKSATKAINDSPIGKAVKNALVPEEERRAYVADFVTVRDLELLPDTKPVGDGGVAPVPGLLRDGGVVRNAGTRPVTPVNLVVHLLDGTNDVLGTFIEEVTSKRKLDPGAERRFEFKVPDKKGFEGKFLHSLR